MKLLRHWKMTLGLLAIFVAGMGTGFVLTVRGIMKFVKHQAIPEVWITARMKELDQRLKLTDEQQARIKPLLSATVDGFHDIVHRGFAEFLVLIGQTHEKVNSELTPEQRAEWAKMREGTMKRWREFAGEEIKKAPPQKPL